MTNDSSEPLDYLEACEPQDFDRSVSGNDELWRWFGLDRASWLTMPRVMMHAMPDEWQAKMVALLREWDATWDSSELPIPFVQARVGNKIRKWPEWLLNYRHPDFTALCALRAKR